MTTEIISGSISTNHRNYFRITLHKSYVSELGFSLAPLDLQTDVLSTVLWSARCCLVCVCVCVCMHACACLCVLYFILSKLCGHSFLCFIFFSFFFHDNSNIVCNVASSKLEEYPKRYFSYFFTRTYAIPQWGTSNEYPQQMCCREISKISIMFCWKK